MQPKVGVIVGVVAVVLAIVAMIGPWWALDTQASIAGFSATGHADFGLYGGTAKFQSGTTSSTNTTNYNDSPHVGSVFSLAMILTIFGLIVGVVMIIVGLMAGSRPSFGRLGGILGVLAFVIVLVGTLYVMSSLPDAVNADSGSTTSFTTVSGFWGTKSATFLGAQATFTWAAGWAWYVALVAAIVFLIAGIALLLARKPAPRPMAAVPPQSA